MKLLLILWVTPNPFCQNRNHQMCEWKRQIHKLSCRKAPRTSRSTRCSALENALQTRNCFKTLKLGVVVRYQRIMPLIHCKQVLVKMRLLQNTANRFSLQIRHSILCKTKIIRPIPTPLKVRLGIRTRWWGQSISCSLSWTFWGNSSHLLQRFKIQPKAP